MRDKRNKAMRMELDYLKQDLKDRRQDIKVLSKMIYEMNANDSLVEQGAKDNNSDWYEKGKQVKYI